MSRPEGVFVYGSLLAPEVLQTLLGRVPPRTAATLQGFARRALRERTYPGVEPCEGSAVQGQVLLELTHEERLILDTFEGPEYACPEVEVATEAGPLRVLVYALTEPGLAVPGSAWDYERWREAHLADFVRMCARFKAGEFPAVNETGAV